MHNLHWTTNTEKGPFAYSNMTIVQCVNTVVSLLTWISSSWLKNLGDMSHV